MNSWSSEEAAQWVAGFMRGSGFSEEKCGQIQQVLREEEVDGEALLLLTANELGSLLGLKQGPAKKLANAAKKTAGVEDWLFVQEVPVHSATSAEIDNDLADPALGGQSDPMREHGDAENRGNVLRGSRMRSVFAWVRAWTTPCLVMLVGFCLLHWLAASVREQTKTMCTELEECAGMTPANVQNHTAVSNMLLSTLPFKSYLVLSDSGNASPLSSRLWKGLQPLMSALSPPCTHSISTLFNRCLSASADAVQSCTTDLYCALPLVASLRRVGAAMGDVVRRHNMHSTQWARVAAVVRRRGEYFSQVLQHTLSQDEEVIDIHEILKQLQDFSVFVDHAQSILNDESLQEKLADHTVQAEKVLNVPLRIARMLKDAGAPEASSQEVDLKRISAMLRQARGQSHFPEVRDLYQNWTQHLCSGLAELQNEVPNEPTAVFVDKLKEHLDMENCPIHEAFSDSLHTRYTALLRHVRIYMEHHVQRFHSYKDIDMVISNEHFKACRLVATALKEHLPNNVQHNLTIMSNRVWSQNVIQQLIQSIREDKPAAAPKALQTFLDYLHFIWPDAEEPMATALRDGFRNLVQVLSERMRGYEDKVRRLVQWPKADMMKRLLQDMRNFVSAVAPSLMVVAEDANMCGQPCLPLEDLLQLLQEHLQLTPAAVPILVQSTRAGVPVQHACDCSAVGHQTTDDKVQRRANALTASADFKKRAAEVVERRRAASDFMRNECTNRSECGTAIQGVSHMFSDKAHEVFGALLPVMRVSLEKREYDEVKAILNDLPSWSELRNVQPDLPTKALEESTHQAILAHANDIALNASQHYNSQRFKSLEDCLTAITTLQKSFGTTKAELRLQLQDAWDELRARIVKYMDGLATTALTFTGQFDMLPAFADDVTTLGLVMFEVPTFRAYAAQRLNELLSTAGTGQGGAQYLITLGKHLMQDIDDGEGMDGTMTRAAAARRVAGEFKQFQAVQTMWWNKAVEKMQKEPRVCVKEMEAKGIHDDQSKPLAPDDLLTGLDHFLRLYSDLLERYLKGEVGSQDIVKQCVEEVSRLRQQQNVSGSTDPVDPRSVKQDIPKLLAYVFMHHTISVTGDDYISLVSDAVKEGKHHELRTGIRTPHNIQVLAVLRFFGYGDAADAKLANQLVQVRTGEGKSQILASSATVFALLGFRVRVVCYSAYLSKRDELEFKQTFAAFKVAAMVGYSKITTYSEDLVAAKGDIRSLTLELLQGRVPLRRDHQPANAYEVLLIDEVDVLMGPDFLGKTHDQVAKLQNERVQDIMTKLWARRREATSVQAAIQLCNDMRKSIQYQELVQFFQDAGDVIDTQLTMMCTGLHDFMQKVPPMPEFDSTQACIGYKILDGIDRTAVHGYKTAFAYLENQERFADAAQQLRQNLVLLVPCGQFSYTNIKPHYIFGVSGTVEQLDAYQRSEVAKHGLLTYTTVPSVYGSSNFRFLEQSDAIKIVTAADFHQSIAMTIDQKIQEKRAILVFFKDEATLENFRKSSFASGVSSSQVLLERLSHDDKAHRIKKAANTGQITLATAMFGRGSDFASYDSKLQEHGGLHVLQTFASLTASEEVQFFGRTARQGQKGTFSLILEEDDLRKDLDLPRTILDNGQGEGYQHIKKARSKKEELTFASIAKKLQQAEERDKLSHQFLRSLASGDRGSALAAFRAYKVWLQSANLPLQHHYIICLDRSWTMEGSSFQLATAAAVEFVRKAKELHRGAHSSVSLVMFNESAETTCREVPVAEEATFAKGIVYSGGRTNFEQPLQAAMKLVHQARDQYNKQFILLYTDGQASFPEGAVREMQNFRTHNKGHLDFFSIAEDGGAVLNQICSELYSIAEVADHCLAHVSPQQISTAMEQTLHQMNLAYVKQN